MGTKYENTLFYQINLTSKYLDKLFEQIFKEADFGVSATEHLALSVIVETKNCCQRDLARLILKDRANTGKLAKSLEEKGLINIELKNKNNRPAKILTATEKGEKLIKDSMEVFKPVIEKIENEITREKIEFIKDSLKDFRAIVGRAVKTNI